MLDKEIIRPSSISESMGIPCRSSKEKSGEWRFSVDYRPLNDVIVADSYPLPRLDDVVQRLAGARYFSTLDLTGGF